jgi:hypothetical protein
MLLILGNVAKMLAVKSESGLLFDARSRAAHLFSQDITRANSQ